MIPFNMPFAPKAGYRYCQEKMTVLFFREPLGFLPSIHLQSKLWTLRIINGTNDKLLADDAYFPVPKEREKIKKNLVVLWLLFTNPRQENATPYPTHPAVPQSPSKSG